MLSSRFQPMQVYFARISKSIRRQEADRISATASVTAPKLPLKCFAQFRFWPSFRYGRKWNLVSACRHRSTAYCPGHNWSSSGFAIWPLARRPSTSSHILNTLQFISLSSLNPPRHVVVYMLHSVGTGYLDDSSITSSAIRFWLRPKLVNVLAPCSVTASLTVCYGLVTQLFSFGKNCVAISNWHGLDSNTNGKW